jgi:DNA repair exonuclease SbcCD ATPase subunit
VKDNENIKMGEHIQSLRERFNQFPKYNSLVKERENDISDLKKQLNVKDNENRKMREHIQSLNRRFSQIPKDSSVVKEKEVEISDLKSRLTTSKEYSLKTVKTMQLQLQNLKAENEKLKAEIRISSTATSDGVSL